MTRRACRGPAVELTQAFWALACRVTLLSASWVIRYTASCTSAGSVRPHPGRAGPSRWHGSRPPRPGCAELVEWHLVDRSPRSSSSMRRICARAPRLRRPSSSATPSSGAWSPARAQRLGLERGGESACVTESCRSRASRVLSSLAASFMRAAVSATYAGLSTATAACAAMSSTTSTSRSVNAPRRPPGSWRAMWPTSRSKMSGTSSASREAGSRRARVAPQKLPVIGDAPASCRQDLPQCLHS